MLVMEMEINSLLVQIGNQMFQRRNANNVSWFHVVLTNEKYHRSAISGRVSMIVTSSLLPFYISKGNPVALSSSVTMSTAVTARRMFPSLCYNIKSTDKKGEDMPRELAKNYQ